jgi:hypothetical protein
MSGDMAADPILLIVVAVIAWSLYFIVCAMQSRSGK